MADTIPGGATKDVNGNWKDAEARPLSKEQIAAAEKFIAEQERAHEQAAAARVEFEAQRDPVARALLAQQASRQVKAEK